MGVSSAGSQRHGTVLELTPAVISLSTSELVVGYELKFGLKLVHKKWLILSSDAGIIIVYHYISSQHTNLYSDGGKMLPAAGINVWPKSAGLTE
jgi:hypothetical protein